MSNGDRVPRPRGHFPFHQRVNSLADHLRPQRWNWYALVRPLDASLDRQVGSPLPAGYLRNLRYFLLDGVFASVSESFYLSYLALYALVLGASNSQVGTLTAVGNLLGAAAFVPGARLVERVHWRKPLIVYSGGGVARAALLGLALVPWLADSPELAIALMIALNGLRAFTGNLANPAWTSLVADLVPGSVRGRYLGSRNMASGVAALVVLPVAGLLITQINRLSGTDLLGYQVIFGLAFATGLVSTFLFQRIREPAPASRNGTLRPAAHSASGFRSTAAFTGLIISAFVWNLSLQIAGPFFNVFLVSGLGANTTEVGLVNAVSSLTALLGYQLFGRWADRKGNLWVQLVTGFLIPALPFAWMIAAEPWHVGIINTFAGFLWAGFNLATFNVLLALAPEAQRPRGVALYQSAVFGSAVIGPLIGGYLADAISFQFIFAVSGIGRLLAMGLFAALVYRRREPALAL